MCGIVGFTGKKDFERLNDLLSAISYRGRDERVMTYENGVNLGMNRLSINDLRTDIFPFKYKKYTLIFNGEIYNYLELKKKLSNKKIDIKTTCDAEVILPLYDIYGVDFLKYLEGMFAIAIVDNNEKKVVLARDRMGEKPLYFGAKNGEFVFGSELKVLAKYFDNKVEIDAKKLGEYFYNGFVSGSGTLLKNVERLKAAHYLIYDWQKKDGQMKRYWSPEIEENNEKEDKVINELSDLIEESVNERLLADVPVGCFLSGGLDSSLITYFASKKVENMLVFSVSFPGYEEHDEIKYAKELAKKLKLKHKIIECNSKNVRDLIKNIGKIIDEPIMDMAVLPTYLLAEKARESVKVVLTGEGADELFGGYERYSREILIDRVRNLIKYWPGKSLLKKGLSGKLGKLFLCPSDYYSTQQIWKSEEILELMGEDYRPENDSKIRKILNKNLMLGMQIKDTETYLSDNLFMKVDKVTMQNNLEARAPYVSSKIVNLAMSLDNNFKIRNGDKKYILKKVAEKYLPKDLVWREKHGFSLPMEQWLRTDLKDLVFDSLKGSEKYKKLINVDLYKKIVNDHMKGVDNTEKIWSILVLTSWLKEYQINEK